MTAETLESLRASFNRRLRAEGKADRTLVLYGQSITYFSEFLAHRLVVTPGGRQCEGQACPGDWVRAAPACELGARRLDPPFGLAGD